MKRWLILVLGASVAVGSVWAQDAKTLNGKGMDLYKAGKFTEAVPLFEQAVEADKDYVYGHYNLACTLAILLREDFCGHLENIGRIFMELYATLQLKPSHREKMLEDEDLSLIRRMFEFWQLVGYSVYEPEELVVILSSVSWAVSSAGAYGPPQRIDFGAGNTVAYQALVWEDGEVSRKSHSGVWELDVSGEVPVIRISFSEPVNEQQEYRVTLSPEGLLYLDGLGMFFSFVEECGA